MRDAANYRHVRLVIAVARYFKAFERASLLNLSNLAHKDANLSHQGAMNMDPVSGSTRVTLHVESGPNLTAYELRPDPDTDSNDGDSFNDYFDEMDGSYSSDQDEQVTIPEFRIQPPSTGVREADQSMFMTLIDEPNDDTYLENMGT